jgi:hypothetical protein
MFSHFLDFFSISCSQNGMSRFAALSAAVHLLGGAQNRKGWAHKITCPRAKNDFPKNQGHGKWARSLNLACF